MFPHADELAIYRNPDRPLHAITRAEKAGAVAFLVTIAAIGIWLGGWHWVG